MIQGDESEIFEQLRLFGNNLRDARKRAGLTQAQLSAAAPLDRAAISRMEYGERAPDMATLLRLTHALGVGIAQLLRGIGPDGSTEPSYDGELPEGPAVLFGANLKWARDLADISQERLALDAKVDRAAVSVYENGRREPNLRTVLKLAHRLEVPPAVLLHNIK